MRQLPEPLAAINLQYGLTNHRAEGIFMLERFFGATITVSSGRVVPVRLVGEQHVREDLGFIPSFADWVRCIRPEPWMVRAQPIHRDG